jgi:glycosyltransferase involved in cell wall biosynthesis
MRITFVAPFVNLTGGIRLLLDWADVLHARGHRVGVVYPLWPYRFTLTRRQQWDEFRRHARQTCVPWRVVNAPVSRVPFIHTRFLPEADAVVATSWPTAYDVARLHHSRGQKVRVAMHHEGDSGSERSVAGTYRLPFRTLTLSKLAAKELRDAFQCEARIVPCGVNPTVFFPDGNRAPNTVLMLYHPAPRKGASDGLAALEIVRRHVPDLRVVLVGPVPTPSLPSWAAFDWFPSDDRLRRHYSVASVLLYPSRYEGFALPPLEAMACGCPVVTTRVGAVPEYAVDGRNAFVVEPGDVSAMARRVESLLRDRELATQFDVEGRRTASRFTTDAAGETFERALVEAMNAAPS